MPVQCDAGRSGGVPDADAAALPGFSVAHLHGGITHATSDGWTENLALPGQSTLDRNPNDQRASMLWYHDHDGTLLDGDGVVGWVGSTVGWSGSDGVLD